MIVMVGFIKNVFIEFGSRKVVVQLIPLQKRASDPDEKRGIAKPHLAYDVTLQ